MSTAYAKPNARFTVPLSGTFAVQDNEVNGWGRTGPYADSSTQDYGDYTARATLTTSNIGGLVFPYPVQFLRAHVKWRPNSFATIEGLAHLMYRQEKRVDANASPNTELIYDGSPITPVNSRNMLTEWAADDLTDSIIPANHVLGYAIGRVGGGTDRTLQVFGGYFEFRRL